MKKVLAFVAVAAFLVTVGCGVAGPVGGLFTSVKSPGMFDPGETTNPGGSAIAGESCAAAYLGLIALGDWSIDAALKAAGAEGKTLKNIAIDYPTLNILGLYGKYCTTVSAVVAQ